MLDLLRQKPVATLVAAIQQRLHTDTTTSTIRHQTWDYQGQPHTLDELCAKSTCAKSTIVQRLKRGWDVAKAVELDSQITSDYIRRGTKRTYLVHGVLLTAHQIEKQYGINADTWAYRIGHGWTVEEALGLTTYEVTRKSTDMRPTHCTTYEYPVGSGNHCTLRELMQYTTINKGTLLSRLNSGWDIQLALSTPAKKAA